MEAIRLTLALPLPAVVCKITLMFSLSIQWKMENWLKSIDWGKAFSLVSKNKFFGTVSL
jgi:hypothetical protein